MSSCTRRMLSLLLLNVVLLMINPWHAFDYCPSICTFVNDLANSRWNIHIMPTGSTTMRKRLWLRGLSLDFSKTAALFFRAKSFEQNLLSDDRAGFQYHKNALQHWWIWKARHSCNVKSPNRHPVGALHSFEPPNKLELLSALFHWWPVFCKSPVNHCLEYLSKKRSSTYLTWERPRKQAKTS